MKAHVPGWREHARRAWEHVLDLTSFITPDGGYHESMDYQRITYGPMTLMAELHRTTANAIRPLRCAVDASVVPAAWRVEVRPLRPAKEDHFLHVLGIGDRNDTHAARVELVEGAGFTGALVEGGTLALFATGDIPVTHGEATIPDMESSACSSAASSRMRGTRYRALLRPHLPGTLRHTSSPFLGGLQPVCNMRLQAFPRSSTASTVLATATW